MPDKNVKITISFRNVENNIIKNLFPSFISFLKENFSEKIANTFQLSTLETKMIEKENHREIMADDNKNLVYFTTKQAITDYDLFKEAVIALKKWQETCKEYNPSVEVKTSFIKFPLYLRNGMYVPPKTFYDLDLVKQAEQTLIDEVNKLLQE